MKSLHELCAPRKSIFDRARKDTVLDVSDLLEGLIQAEAFFDENYLTAGMKTLLREAFRRFAGKSGQAVFRLTQAMGGGKTHNMIALGLLAQTPGLRRKVLGDTYEGGDVGAVKVIGFTGRESDAPLGIWGALADQLGKKEVFKDYYSPLQAPGQSAWINLLKGQPLLILLDELPPYFENARSKTIGNSDLAKVTTTALSNLLTAVNKKELSNVCVVISDLKATYEGGSQQISKALSELEAEVGRGALPLEPVALNTDELYHILRTRLFEKLPAEEDIKAVAGAYSQAVKDAKQMDITRASPEQFAAHLRESFPFHFSIKDLYARFRENAGFQQTRGLIRFMRVVVAHLWDSGAAKKISLIHPYDIDLNHGDTMSEINSINSTLGNAISHDIASNGASVAEALDSNLGGKSEDAQDALKLLLMASLANSQGATLGLNLADTISFLCRPGRDIARLPKDILGVLATSAWYLHTDREGRLFFKNVQNLVAKLNTIATGYTREISLKELQGVLKEIFEPSLNDCYQSVQALPPVDEIKLEQDKVLLVISEPTAGGGLDGELVKFWRDVAFRNRVAFLTGERETMDRLLETAAELKAITGIIAELESQKTPENDPQFVAAQEMEEKIRMRLLSIARETFTKMFYPASDSGGDKLLAADFLMNFQDNNYKGEEQVRDVLLQKQKFTKEIDSDTFRKKCEQRLFTQQIMAFGEVRKRAAMNPKWQWHHPSALESLKDRMILADQWREDGGLIDKGPFPPPKTSVQVQELKRDSDSGEALLRLKPIHGDKVHYEIGSKATTGSSAVENLQNFSTKELVVSFLAVDSSGQHATGEPREWRNQITLKHRLFQAGKERMCELQAAPAAPITYTTDGSDPRNGGGTYDAPFVIPPGTVVILACAEKAGVQSQLLRIDVPKDIEAVEVNPALPVEWNRQHTLETTKDSFEFLARMKRFDARCIGVRMTVAGVHWMEMSADGKLRLDAAQMESIFNCLRAILAEGQAQLDCTGLAFEKGQQLLDWVAEVKTELKPDEVNQCSQG